MKCIVSITLIIFMINPLGLSAKEVNLQVNSHGSVTHYCNELVNVGGPQLALISLIKGQTMSFGQTTYSCGEKENLKFVFLHSSEGKCRFSAGTALRVGSGFDHVLSEGENITYNGVMFNCRKRFSD